MPKQVSRIAIIITSGLGNNIMAMPAIASVRKKYRNSRIDLYTYYRASSIFFDMAKSLGLDNIYVDCPDFGVSYDVTIKLLADGRFDWLASKSGVAVEVDQAKFAKQHEVVVNNEAVWEIGCDPENELVPYPHEAEVENVDLPRRYFVVHVGYSHSESFWAAKNWGGKNYTVLLQKFHMEHGLWPVVIGTGEDRPDISELHCSKIVLYDLGFPQVNKLIKGADFFVGNDSGMMHFAAMAGVPTFGIFTFTSPVKNAPVGDKCHFIGPTNLECSPCYTQPGDKPCHNFRRCADAVKPRDVYSFIRSKTQTG